jgi:hypothetical protein
MNVFLVTFDKPPDPALIDTATCIDAINYFCDMMMEKALESLKRGGRKPPGAKENVVQAKNTVLVLPKLPQYVNSIDACNILILHNRNFSVIYKMKYCPLGLE